MKKHLHKIKESAKKPLHKILRKQPSAVEKTKVPYITNETIAEHREEVLSGARKYIYPLQHSKHRIVLLSSIILGVTLIVFTVFSVLNLYRFQSTSTFVYRITQIVPYPVARVEGRMVSYENYLFELRHYMHYYETQQKLSFDTQEGQRDLSEYKKQALQQVIDDAYIKHLADKNKVSISNQEVDQEIAIVREQNRLGTSDQVFEDVLRDFWGWSVNDFRRSLRQQLLARKVVSTLDTEAQAKAKQALAELKAGADFAEVAKKYSTDEVTREAGGDYGIALDKSNRDISAKVTNKIFNQKVGEYSDIIDTGYSLEIVKTLAFEGDKARAAHIQITLKDINERLEPIKQTSPPSRYLSL
jgi:hypothetical protein